ncbi:MAG: DUF438 domain-containing protein [Gallicola sp.]|uniref:DUF438 domain-containing protein n=1 Tax=Gallicola sp. Sow4_E12 TaxID=3438785 RepID=UPI001801255B|nr:DUF438 domain-containing protein [Gallicola sp.]
MNKELIKDILLELHKGEDIAVLKKKVQEMEGMISSKELAEAEDLLEGSSIPVDEIQRLSTAHTELFSGKLKEKEVSYGHPVFVFMGENRGLEKFIEEKYNPALEAFLADQKEKNLEEFRAQVEELKKVGIHYDRKENLFFPYLENAGITTPPQVMWGVDDVIRDLIGKLSDSLKGDIMVKRVELVSQRVLTQVYEMIEKEDKILVPMILDYLTEEDFILAAQESVHMGYVFNQGIEGASNSDANTWLSEKTKGEMKTRAMEEDKIQISSGSFYPKELEAMLNTLPTDLTYADKDDIVRYYSEGKHQVFTRTRTILGRDLYLCHPPQLIPVIKELIADFKSGKKDEMIVPMRKGNRLELIRYYAVRGEDGEYLGVVEVTEEISDQLEMFKDL